MTAVEGEGAKEAPSKKIRMPHRPEDIPESIWESIRPGFRQGNCDNPEVLARIIMRGKEEGEEELNPGWRRVDGNLEVKCACKKWVLSRFIECSNCGKQLHKPHSMAKKEAPAKVESEGISFFPKPSN